QNEVDQVPASLVNFNTALDAYVFPTLRTAAGAVCVTGQTGCPAPQRVNPAFGAISGTEWSGHSSYHALQANLVERPVKGLTFQIAYTWSKSIDNGSSVGNEASESSNTSGAGWAFCTSCQKGTSDFDIPHNLVVNFQYDIPVPAGIKTHKVSNAVLGG